MKALRIGGAVHALAAATAAACTAAPVSPGPHCIKTRLPHSEAASVLRSRDMERAAASVGVGLHCLQEGLALLRLLQEGVVLRAAAGGEVAGEERQRRAAITMPWRRSEVDLDLRHHAWLLAAGGAPQPGWRSRAAAACCLRAPVSSCQGDTRCTYQVALLALAVERAAVVPARRGKEKTEQHASETQTKAAQLLSAPQGASAMCLVARQHFDFHRTRAGSSLVEGRAQAEAAGQVGIRDVVAPVAH